MILQALKNNYKIQVTLLTFYVSSMALCYLSVLGSIIYVSTSGMIAQPPQVPCI